MSADTLRPPCPDERPHDCAAVDAEPWPLPLAQQPTVRPPACGCGRPEIAGHACAGCDAPQWVPWPTHAGWWWAFGPNDCVVYTLVEADELLDVWEGIELHARGEPAMAAFRFLDARLTPPAAPGAR